MQWVKTTRDNILKPLQTVTGIVERRHSLPILSNIYIEKEGENCSFTTTDTEMQITTIAPIGLGKASFSSTVAAYKLQDILRALPDAETTISFENKKFIIKNASCRFTLTSIDAEEYPTIQLSTENKANFSIKQKDFKNLLSLTHFAMAQHDVRHYFNGLLLKTKNNSLIAAATDGHRLAVATFALETNVDAFEVIIPRKAVGELQRLLDSNDEHLHISLSELQARFTFNQTEIISKLIGHKYPDYERVIPQNHTKQVVIAREPFQQALQRAALLIDKNLKCVQLSLKKNVLSVKTHNQDHEEAHDEIEVNYTGEAIETSFNVQYLLDVVNQVKSTSFQMSFGDVHTSMMMSLPDKESESFKYVVMPMKQ